MSENKKIAEGLRKVAKDLRDQAASDDAEKTEKIAHVLIAAHGLNRLREIIQNPGGQG